VGCGHFRTDVSYFLDMEAYLADLRAQPGTSARHLRCRPVRRLPRLLTAEIRGVALPQDEAGGHADAGRPARRAMEVLGGRGARLALLTASLLGDLVIALLTVHLTGQWQ
jgi:hypothetical protein